MSELIPERRDQSDGAASELTSPRSASSLPHGEERWPGFLERIRKVFTRSFGSEGKRSGARDTDPGSHA